MLLSKCTVCDGKRLKFIREKETSGLLNSLGIKTPLNKVPLLVNKFLLGGDKFMPEMYLRQPGFTYGACELFTKKINHEYKNLKKQEIQHDMAYGNFKDLTRRTASDKTSKFKWMLNNIRAGKIILTPIWNTILLDFRFQLYQMLNDATLRKWQKP